MGSIAIRWAKAGVAGLVHEFKGGKDHLQEQDALFQGRTAVFADQVIGGNASLELRDVQLSDAGTYWCSVTTARGSGVAVLRYRTGAFSTPRVHVENSSGGDTLQCEAPRWFPRPAVHWTAYSDAGGYLPHVANTSYELNAENITLKVVSFLHNITANATYTCVIENNIAKATGNIKVTGRVYHHPETTGTGEEETLCGSGGSCSIASPVSVSGFSQGRDRNPWLIQASPSVPGMKERVCVWSCYFRWFLW
ncbi:V-set domain-containing T-cell activation inhibitor 1 isoform 4-T4 [Morphnus guianensis]